MNSCIKLCIFSLIILLVLLIISVGYHDSSNAIASEGDNIQNKESELPEELKELQIEIAMVVSDDETVHRLAFIAINNSNFDITIPEFRRNHNRIAIIGPNGKSYGEDSEWGGIPKQIKIQPSETKIWFLDVARIIDNRLYPEEGLYRIKWKINNYESKEFLLLKEKDKEENHD